MNVRPMYSMWSQYTVLWSLSSLICFTVLSNTNQNVCRTPLLGLNKYWRFLLPWGLWRVSVQRNLVGLIIITNMLYIVVLITLNAKLHFGRCANQDCGEIICFQRKIASVNRHQGHWTMEVAFTCSQAVHSQLVKPDICINPYPDDQDYFRFYPSLSADQITDVGNEMCV